MAPVTKSRIYGKHPLLFKYFALQVSVFVTAIAIGLTFSFIFVPHQKRALVVGEMVRGCEKIGLLEKDRGIGAQEALRAFESINRGFFVRETQLLGLDDPTLTSGIAKEPPCTPHWYPWRHSRLELRLDDKTALVTDILPPTRAHLQMVEEQEGPGTYEVQHHHPVIFGMLPESLSLVILIVFLFAGFVSAVVGGYHLFRRATAEAATVLDRLRDGDLKARFPEGYESLGAHFNAMADEIEKLVRELREAESLRVRMLQELTHDLKTPVAGVRGILESLGEKYVALTEAERTDLLETGIRETIYFSRLVDDLLFISGVKDSASRVQTGRVDLAKLVADEVAAFSKNEDMRVTFAAEGAAVIYGEYVLLQRLVRNGLDNALSFAESEVAVQLRATATHWCIEIADNGPGPSQEDVASFGTKRGTRRQTAANGRISIGLGSVIMRKIARSYGGDAVLAREGHGARLTLTLAKQ